MILSASRRTDIPCWYSEWFMNRLKAGFVLTRNPVNSKQISRIALSPETLDCIVFWTKDFQNMMDKLPHLDEMGYRYYVQFTVTPYDHTIEKSLRPKKEILKTFESLSKKIGRHRVLWRYDPILLTDTYDISYHSERFSKLCKRLCGYTESVTVSFVDFYQKQRSNHPYRAPDERETVQLSQTIAQTAKRYGITPKACCERSALASYGIEKASCIDKTVIERICGTKLKLDRDKNQRSGCGCYESVDIGLYGTCQNGCVYCYANRSAETARRHFMEHNPCGALLYGTVREGDVIKDRVVQSCLQNQLSLFE